MTRLTVHEYAAALRPRYGAAKKEVKKRILDEFCQTTGMHRKAAIRLLARRSRPVPVRRGRPRRYGLEVAQALVKLWEVGDRMCGKLLAAVLSDLLAALERHGELRVSPQVRELLLTISRSTIDRLLRRHRLGRLRQPQRPSPASTALKSQIPIRTWSDWQDAEPGSLQADLVLHCGESAEGFFLTTLCAVDVATGWTELQPVWGMGKQRVSSAIHHIRQRLPVALKALHTDNGSEFINHVLHPWCQREGIQFTRGRSYRKNDQAYVEQKNWLSVRRQVGYDRYNSRRAFALLQQLYPYSRCRPTSSGRCASWWGRSVWAPSWSSATISPGRRTSGYWLLASSWSRIELLWRSSFSLSARGRCRAGSTSCCGSSGRQPSNRAQGRCRRLGNRSYEASRQARARVA